MKVILKSIDQAYNEFGCGQRLQFLIIYNNKRNWREGRNSINLNRRLNKLVDYWNMWGKPAGIIKHVMYTAFGNNDFSEGEISGYERYFQQENKIINPQKFNERAIIFRENHVILKDWEYQFLLTHFNPHVIGEDYAPDQTHFEEDKKQLKNIQVRINQIKEHYKRGKNK